MTTLTKRIVSIDILRGISIFMMILCANIGWHSGLPGWMFHCQTPPPTYAFNPANAGITWVDLVFPFFLFAMGAAFPLAMRKKLDNGVSRWNITAGLFRRWLTLSIFAIVLGNAYSTSIGDKPAILLQLFRIALWFTMFLSLVRLDRYSWGKHVNNAGLIMLIALAVIRTDCFGCALNRWSSDIIIMILANIAIWGGLIWMFTRNSIRLRWLCILLITVFKALSSYTPEVLSWVPQFSAIGWLFSWSFLQYLVIALIGSIVGDYLLAHSQKGETTQIDSFHIIAGISAVTAVILQLWGLYTRQVLADFIITAAVGVVYIMLTYRRQNIMTRIGYIGFIILLAGIAFDPIDGGITKDHCNISYLLTTSGMAALTTSFLLMLEFRWDIKGRGFSGTGQNPMLAYTVTNFLIGPVIAMCRIGAWLDTICIGSPFWGIVRGLFYTLLMVGLTCFFTKKKLFWRS